MPKGIPKVKVGRKGICFNTGRTHFKKGLVPWNKGLTSQTDNRVKEGGIKTSKALKGRSMPKPEGYSETMRKAHPPLRRRMANNGYILIYNPEWPSAMKTKACLGRVWEHYYVLEKHLGRSIRPEERVHHLNGDKADNRLDNLYLCKDSSTHIKLHQQEQRFTESLVKEGKVYFDGELFTFKLR